MQVSGSKNLEGVHGAIKVLDLERARLLDRPDFSRRMDCFSYVTLTSMPRGGCLVLWQG